MKFSLAFVLIVCFVQIHCLPIQDDAVETTHREKRIAKRESEKIEVTSESKDETVTKPTEESKPSEDKPKADTNDEKAKSDLPEEHAKSLDTKSDTPVTPIDAEDDTRREKPHKAKPDKGSKGKGNKVTSTTTTESPQTPSPVKAPTTSRPIRFFAPPQRDPQSDPQPVPQFQPYIPQPSNQAIRVPPMHAAFYAPPENSEPQANFYRHSHASARSEDGMNLGVAYSPPPPPPQSYAPASYAAPEQHAYAPSYAPVQCPQNLLISCQPTVRQVPCSSQYSQPEYPPVQQHYVPQPQAYVPAAPVYREADENQSPMMFERQMMHVPMPQHQQMPQQAFNENMQLGSTHDTSKLAKDKTLREEVPGADYYFPEHHKIHSAPHHKSYDKKKQEYEVIDEKVEPKHTTEKALNEKSEPKATTETPKNVAKDTHEKSTSKPDDVKQEKESKAREAESDSKDSVVGSTQTMVSRQTSNVSDRPTKSPNTMSSMQQSSEKSLPMTKDERQIGVPELPESPMMHSPIPQHIMRQMEMEQNPEMMSAPMMRQMQAPQMMPEQNSRRMEMQPIDTVQQFSGQMMRQMEPQPSPQMMPAFMQPEPLRQMMPVQQFPQQMMRQEAPSMFMRQPNMQLMAPQQQQPMMMAAPQEMPQMQPSMPMVPQSDAQVRNMLMDEEMNRQHMNAHMSPSNDGRFARMINPMENEVSYPQPFYYFY